MRIWTNWSTLTQHFKQHSDNYALATLALFGGLFWYGLAALFVMAIYTGTAW